MDVAVLGAGQRGRGIAGRCAVAGHTVAIRDEDANVVMDTVDEIQRAHNATVGERVSGTTGLEAAVVDAELVVDATDRDVDARRDLLASVEDLVDEETLVAASDPATAVTAVAVGLRRPERAIGLQFVHPDASGLVEVVVAEATTEDTVERAREFVDGIGNTAIVVSDSPGFVTSRLDLALVVEATRMVESGVASVDAIDDGMAIGRDHPKGPLALADEIGLERVIDGLESLADDLDGRFDPPGLLYEKVSDGATGKRVGEGFYVWTNGEPVEPAEPNPTVTTRDPPAEDPDR